MGTMHYGSDEAEVSVDDETMAHLAAVVVAKLRRREPFLLTVASVSGRDSLWIHEASTLRWAFETNAHVALDRVRLEAMVREANRPTGLTVERQDRPVFAPVGALAVAA